MTTAELWARWFLIIAAAGFLFAYALPLFFVPLRWARMFRWALPEDDLLCVYLGRCLGGVAIALVVGCLVAAADPARNSIILLTVAVACGFMTVVHVWGALAKRQPWPEHLEIPMYAILALASGYFYAVL